MKTLGISIEASYQKVYEITTEQVAQAIDSLEEPNIPPAMRQDLLKKAHDAAYAFVDSVINSNRYTHNPDLIKAIQDTHMENAIAMYDRIFDEFSASIKLWQEVAPAKE